MTAHASRPVRRAQFREGSNEQRLKAVISPLPSRTWARRPSRDLNPSQQKVRCRGSNGLGLRHRPRRAGAAGVGAGGDGAVADGEGGAVALAQLAEEGDEAWMVA